MKIILTLTLAACFFAPALLRAENIVYPAGAGVLDVTKAPYNADPTGAADSTAALQSALNDDVGSRQILYFPNGTYRISSTLTVPLTRGGSVQYGFTHLQGQSQAGVVIRLQDGAFPDAGSPKPLLTFGPHNSADFGANSVRNLTLNTGSGNPGAVGLQFFSTNTGCVRDVTIRSGDGQGVSGLDLSYNDLNGPLLIKGLTVSGFGYGVKTGSTVNSQTFEHVAVSGQSVSGFYNGGQCVSVRALQSTNSVTAVSNGGVMTLIDSTLTGGAAGVPAVSNTACLFARNLNTGGYAPAIHNTTTTSPTADAPGPGVTEWVSTATLSLFPSPSQSLNLPIQETPDVPWDDPSTWAKVGPRQGTETDDSAAVQRAIDSGATTVYFPTSGYSLGSTIHVRGNVQHILGLYSYLDGAAPLNGQNAPYFQFDGGTAPTVVLEGFSGGYGAGAAYWIQNNSRQTLVLRDVDLNAGSAAYKNGAGAGPVFIEDVVSPPWLISGGSVWARQLNTENNATDIVNTGGTVWILGLKTEKNATLIDTEAGGLSELLGGLSYTQGDGTVNPMFINNGSSVSLTIGEVYYGGGNPYSALVRETRDGVTQTLNRGGAPYWINGSLLPLYVGYKDAALSGAVIGTPGSYNNAGNTIAKVFDGNTNTFFDGPAGVSAPWAGQDLGAGVTKAVTRIRFFPRAGFAARMKGGKFQGSNSATFSSGVTNFATLSAAPPDGQWSQVTSASTTKFRYVRYQSPAGSHGNVAEVVFYGR